MNQTTRKNKLGRGLADLFADSKKNITEDDSSDSSEDTSSFEIFYVDINSIRPCATQPRRFFNEDGLRELADSIKKNGFLQPIILKNRGEQYEIIAGERRWRAAKLIEITKIPAIIREYDDQDTLVLSIVENLQRVDLSVIEEALAYKKLVDAGYTHEQIASSVGKSRSYVTNVIRLNLLSDTIKHLIISGDLSVSHARTLIGKENAEMLAQKMIREHLNVRDAENLSAKKNKIFSSNQIVKNEMEELAEMLSSSLKLLVKINNNNVVISYNTPEELDKLIEKLMNNET